MILMMWQGEKKTMEEQNNFEISSGNAIKKESEKNKVKIEEPPKINSGEYHKEEIELNKMIVKNAIHMIWVGIILIITSFIVYVCKLTDTLVAGTICGCFIDLFSGTILYLFNKSNENKQSYFKDLSNNEKEEKIIGLVESMKDEKIKEKLIENLINEHFKK